MIDDFNNEEIIEQYVLGKLQGEQLAAFVQKLSYDEEFKRQVELEKAIIRNIKAVGRQAKKSKLKNLHQRIAETSSDEVEAKQIQVQNGRKNKQKHFLWLVAASVALLIISSVLITIFYINKPTLDTVYASYYQPYPSTQVVRGGQDSANLRVAAFIAYNDGNYLQSIDLFKRVLSKEKDEESLFYLGNAYLSANMPEEAIKVFTQYLQAYEEFEVEANWYLSLSYLKAGKIKEARTMLEKLTTYENSHQDKAIRLLKDLKKL